ncbi:MAG: RNA-protein complex protein Nop10 [Candidatus Helarchaeota archaeon]
MGKFLKKCKKCGRYTMKEDLCPDPNCGGETVTVNPPRFSLQDKYGRYRREFKKMHEL